MTPSSTTEAAIATRRIGFGARPGELAAVAPGPRGWLLAQLGREHRAPPSLVARLAAAYRASDGDLPAGLPGARHRG